MLLEVSSFSVLFFGSTVVVSLLLLETSFSELRVALFSFSVEDSFGLAFANNAASNLSISLINIVSVFPPSVKFTAFPYGVSITFNESGESLKIPASKFTFAVSSGVSSTFLLSVVLFSSLGVLTSLLGWFPVLLLLFVLLSFSSSGFVSVVGLVDSDFSVVLFAYFSKSALSYLALENSIGNEGSLASLENWSAEERSVTPSLSVSFNLLYYTFTVRKTWCPHVAFNVRYTASVPV